MLATLERPPPKQEQTSEIAEKAKESNYQKYRYAETYPHVQSNRIVHGMCEGLFRSKITLRRLD